MQNDEGQTVKSLHNIVYCSRAVHSVDKEALEKIIATARHHNPRFGITGLLVFGSGVFFQWLEGPKDNVTSLFKMISADARHSDVVLLTQEDEFRERLFPNWARKPKQATRGALVRLPPAYGKRQDAGLRSRRAVLCASLLIKASVR